MITDTFLEETAKAWADETYAQPNYLAMGTSDVDSIAATDTALSEEVGARMASTFDRKTNQIEISAIRSATSVIDNINGDTYGSVGLFNTATEATTDPLLMGFAVSGVTQTTNFDVEVVHFIKAVRK